MIQKILTITPRQGVSANGKPGNGANSHRNKGMPMVRYADYNQLSSIYIHYISSSCV